MTEKGLPLPQEHREAIQRTKGVLSAIHISSPPHALTKKLLVHTKIKVPPFFSEQISYKSG